MSTEAPVLDDTNEELERLWREKISKVSHQGEVPRTRMVVEDEPEDIYPAPSYTKEPKSKISAQLSDIENVTMAVLKREEWFVPASSESTEWTRATIYDTNGGSWLVDRQAYTRPSNPRVSSVVIGSRLYLVHTDNKGNVRRFDANIPFYPQDSDKAHISYSEVKNGVNVRFVNGSNIEKASTLVEEFAKLTPENVILVKNEITKPARQMVWSNDTIPVHRIDRLLTRGLRAAPVADIFNNTKPRNQSITKLN